MSFWSDISKTLMSNLERIPGYIPTQAGGATGTGLNATRFRDPVTGKEYYGFGQGREVGPSPEPIFVGYGSEGDPEYYTPPNARDLGETPWNTYDGGLYTYGTQGDRFDYNGQIVGETDLAGQRYYLTDAAGDTTMTAPPRDTSGSFVDFLKDIAPSALIPFAGPLAGALGGGLAGAAGSGAILGGGGAALTGGDIGRGALLGGAGGAIGNALFGALGGNAAPFDPNSIVGDPLYGGQGGGVGASVGGGYSAAAPFTNTVENFGATNTAYPEAVAGTSAGYPGSDPFLGETSVLGGGGAMPPAVPVGSDPFLGEESILGGGGTMPPAVTPGLIAKIAAYTGLSTGAVERLGGTAISALAGLYGANVVGNAADRAANRLAESNQAATQLQSKMYEDQVARQQPFYQAGVNALPAYTKGVMPGGDLVRPFSMSDYQADPGYGFRLSEGMKALDRTAASRGNLLSGATFKGAQRFNQDMASNEYNNAYNRYVGNQATQRNALAGLTGFAPTAAQQLNASGANYASNVTDLGTSTARNYANADLTGAAARQSAYGGAGGAFANALSPNPYIAFLNKQMGVIG